MNEYQLIVLKENLDKTDYENINKLKTICLSYENISFKLELDYKISASSKDEKINRLNEFLYYDDNQLIGYIGLCQFSGEIVEVNGLVHPKFRRKGIFSKLFSLVLDEWNKRDSVKMLLLCDKNSISGQSFMKKTGAIYNHTEYEMVLSNNYKPKIFKNDIDLRKATNQDAKEIAYQNAIYFNIENKEDAVFNFEDEELHGQTFFMAEVNKNIVGKVHYGIIDNSAVIYGFGVKPEYRNKGYGTAILNNVINNIKEKNINNISLQVDAINNNALNLYEKCGFVASFAMDYFKLGKK
jgi:ribosomal protein S18 acetylase RimI-like enzyme